MTVLEISSIEILWVININKDYPTGWGGQTLANTYNKLSIKKSSCRTVCFGGLQAFQKPKIFKKNVKKSILKDFLWAVELFCRLHNMIFLKFTLKLVEKYFSKF